MPSSHAPVQGFSNNRLATSFQNLCIFHDRERGVIVAKARKAAIASKQRLIAEKHTPAPAISMVSPDSDLS